VTGYARGCTWGLNWFLQRLGGASLRVNVDVFFQFTQIHVEFTTWENPHRVPKIRKIHFPPKNFVVVCKTSTCIWINKKIIIIVNNNNIIVCKRRIKI